jgi:hypothetical protein
LPAYAGKQLRQWIVRSQALLDLHETTFAGFLHRYAMNTAWGIYGVVGNWFINVVRRKPNLTLKKSESVR